MANIQSYIEELIDALTKLPGVGRKGAERIAYFIIHSDTSTAKDLITSLDNINNELAICDDCGMIFLKKDNECSCSLASNTKHICVVENIEDAIKIQNTHSYDGLYHVLGGAISPLDGIGPSELSFDKLKAELTNWLLYFFSSLSATCNSPSMKRELPNSSSFRTSICWSTFETKFSKTSLTT